MGADDRLARRDRRRIGATKPTAELPELPHEDARPAYEDLGELTDGLPPKERAAVVLRYGYDLTYDQIAAALDSSPDAARQAASTGVRRLRKEDRDDRSHRSRPPLPRGSRRAAACSTRATTSSTRRSAQLLVAATDRGLLRISFDPDAEHQLERLARLAGRACCAPPRRSTRRAGSSTSTSRDGATRSTSRSTSAALTPFSERVLDGAGPRPLRRDGDVRASSPRGRATRRPRARSGRSMNRNPIPIVLPCHRIIGANGSLVGYGGGLERKEALLRLEGVLL